MDGPYRSFPAVRLFLLILAVVGIALPTAAQHEATLVADIRPGSGDSRPLYPTVYDGRLFFAAYDGQGGRDLWAYDAATGEASLAADVDTDDDWGPRYLAVYDGRLFFNHIYLDVVEDQKVWELWAYDAATGQASPLDDDLPRVFNPQHFTVYDGRLFFQARGDDHQRGLWVYDAATDEAVPVSVTLPDRIVTVITFIIVYDDRLFFATRDDQFDRHLWVLDAADGEATPVAEIPLEVSNSLIGQPEVYDGRLFFGAGNGGNADGIKLLAYDAATGEITPTIDALPSEGAIPSGLTVYDERLFFGAGGTFGRWHLWAYDAVADEAGPVTTEFESPQDLAVHDGSLFFGAFEGAGADAKWWSYDAATGQALPVAALGSGGSGVPVVAVYEGRLFLAADDSQSGNELWVVTPTAVADEPSPVASPARRSIRLDAVHPSPIRSGASVNVTVDISEFGPIRVVVYDVLGRRIVLLHEGSLPAGEHRLPFDTSALPAGAYFVHATGAGASATATFTVAR